GRWRLFDSGETWLHQRGAKRLVTAADFQIEQARQDLILEIVKTYYGVLVMKENEKAAEEAVKTAEASEHRMETIHKRGLWVDSDAVSGRVFLPQRGDRHIRAQNDLALTEMQLAREMGTEVETPAEPAGVLAEPSALTKTIQEWIQTASQERPALRAAQ